MPVKSTIRHNAFNIVLALLWSRFAYVYATAFLENPAFVTALFFVLETSIVIAFCIRRPAFIQSNQWHDWVPAFGAIVIGMLFQPSWKPRDVALGYILQVVGVCVTLLGMLSIGRSFAILPANRGLRTGGIYAYIRHPIYAGYMLVYSGYTILNPLGVNFMVLLCCVGMLFWRAANEERLLARDPSWFTYAKRVRWRFLPYIH